MLVFLPKKEAKFSLNCNQFLKNKCKSLDRDTCLVGLIVIIIKDELGSYHQIFFGNGIQHTNKDVEIIRIGKESSTNSKSSF